MIDSIFEKVGEKTGERVFAASLSPAFLFWLGGYICWDLSQNWWASRQIGAFFATVTSDSEALSPMLYLVAGGLLISWLLTLSAAIVERLELPVLRLLEGYWPGWCGIIRQALVRRVEKRQSEWNRRLQDLASKKDHAGLNVSEGDEYTRLYSAIRSYPSAPEALMPTRIGNLLRAGEMRPSVKYGLDAVICWPRLWLLLPKEVQTSLASARDRLARATRTWIWSALFLVWTIWAHWAALISLVFLLVCYRAMLESAQTFAVLVEASFDVHRGSLYKALRWPLPGNAAAEFQAGEQITAYLWQGSHDSTIRFTGGE